MHFSKLQLIITKFKKLRHFKSDDTHVQFYSSVYPRCDSNSNFAKFPVPLSQTELTLSGAVSSIMYKEQGSFCLPQCLYRRQ